LEAWEEAWFQKREGGVLQDSLIPGPSITSGGMWGSRLYINGWYRGIFTRDCEIYYCRDGYEVGIIIDDLKVGVEAGKSLKRYPKGVIASKLEMCPTFCIIWRKSNTVVWGINNELSSDSM